MSPLPTILHLKYEISEYIQYISLENVKSNLQKWEQSKIYIIITDIQTAQG